MKNTGRKIYHLAGGLFLLGIYSLFDRPLALAVYLALLGGILLFDAARLRIPAFNRWTQRRMGTLLRPGEAETISGSPSYVAGVALALLLFDLPVATAAILFLAVGDVAATAVGEAWGRTRIGQKSLEGSAAFLASGLLAGLAARAAGSGPAIPVLLAGVCAAAAVEILTPPRLNDNLTIPLCSGAVMALLS